MLYILNNKMQTKCAIISIIGKPNSGKSTFLNNIIGEKISITSPKAQTTRREIRGILEEGDTQLIFIDTPGINYRYKPKNILEKSIINNYQQAYRNADLCLLIIDPTDKNCLDQYCINANVIAINKIDLIKNKSNLLPIMHKLQESNIKDIFPISSVTGEGISTIKQYLLNTAPLGPWLYLPMSSKTDQDIKFRLSELTRETIFYKLQCELPYNIYVVTDNVQQTEKQLKILQTIVVLKDSQKSIVIGKNGNMIHSIKIDTVKKIKRIFNKTIDLKLFVKVQKNWINKKDVLVDAV